MNVTRANIDNMAGVILALLIKLGMANDRDKIIVHAGSATKGNSWGLELRDTVDGYTRPIRALKLHGCYTKRQAYDRMTAAYDALWAVWDHQNPTA